MIIDIYFLYSNENSQLSSTHDNLESNEDQKSKSEEDDRKSNIRTKGVDLKKSLSTSTPSFSVMPVRIKFVQF